MASPGFDVLTHKLGVLQRELSGEAIDKALVKVGVEAKKDAIEAVKADLGDDSMSGWWKPSARRPNRKPIPIVTSFDVKAGTVLEITPQGKSKGPWRVLEEGRKAGTKGEFREYTKKRKVKGGGTEMVTARRRNKRSVGTTPAKHTWSEAGDLMIARTPSRAHRFLVVEPMSRLFGR